MTFNMPWNFNITDRAAIRQQCTIYHSSLAQYLRLGHSLTINLAQDGETPEDVLNLDSEVLTEIDQRVNHLLLRQLNNRIQSSLYFAKEGWSKYAFT